MHFPAPPRLPGTNGRPLRHGAAFKLADERSWPAPAAATVTQTTRYGTARAAAWGRLHQQLASRAGWEDHHDELPVVEGTLIRLHVDRLPGDRSPEPLWLWSSRARTSAAEVDRAWQAFLRRFDIEHMFRFFKQVLGWARPRLRGPGRRRPVDLDCHRLLCPAPPRPRARRRPAAALAAALPARPADPRPGPPRVPEHPPGTPRSGQRTETRQTRPRPPARLEEPPPGHPPRRGKDHQAG